MCGRFTLHTPLDEVLTYFSLPTVDFEFNPSYNIAPTQQVLAVTSTSLGPSVSLMRWGLIPPWQLGVPRSAPPLINARLESLTEKRTFSPLVENSRCLILADGFYEWKMINGRKQPFYLTLHDKKPFAFAGLCLRETQPSCTIITKDSRGSLQDLHHRMPVILNPKQAHCWLGSTPFVKLRETFLNNHDDGLVYHPVSPLVNSPKHNEPECIQPIRAKGLFEGLF